MKKSKPITYKQAEWDGIIVNADPTDINEKNCVDAYNVDISTTGELANIEGSEKQYSTGLGSAIDFLWQNGKGGTDYNFVWYNGVIAKL